MRDVFAEGRRSYSFEFFPPKDDAGERRLWGAVRLTARIAAETPLTPVAHVTCVGHDVSELRQVLEQYAAAGVRAVLALRGDPPTGPGTPWRRHPGGLDNAVQVVELVRSLGDFDIGVAAFPEGHPEAPDA